MKTSRLNNIAKKTKHPISYTNDIKNYNKQRNYVVNLNRNAKCEYFNIHNSADGEPFWVSC